jgi:DNA-binding Lrp family transcriptional regulator
MTMNTTNPTTVAGSNSADRLKSLKDDLRALGAQSAKGEGSRPMVALIVCQGAYEGTVRNDDDDIKELYGAYVSAAAKVAAANPFVTSAGKNIEHKSATQQVSKLKVFIRLGLLPGVEGPDLMKQTAKMIKNISADPDARTYSAYDGMLIVARKQLEDPNNALTEEQIAALVTKDDPAEKDTLEKLCTAYKSLLKLDKDLSLPGTAAAVQDIADQIKDLGGELPPVTKKEKEEAAFMEKAKARGFVSMKNVTLYDGSTAH